MKNMEVIQNATKLSPDGNRSIEIHIPRLLAKAKKAMSHAIAPSSNFRVGAAILAANGRLFSGCNIESPVYLGLCAERVALFKGLSEGARDFLALAIICQEPIPLLPCGTCRQLLWEFAPELTILVVHNDQVQPYNLSDLLPKPFERHGRGPFRSLSKIMD